MTSAVDAISALDRALAMVGGAGIVRRYTGTESQTSVEAAVVALVRGYIAHPVAPGAAIQQAEHLVTISPTGLRLAGYPEPIAKGDRIVVDGREHTINQVSTSSVAGITVRYDLTVRG